MKLLLDQNLSPRLVKRLADVFPGCAHVDSVGLATATDREVWSFARANSFLVVTKDADFSDMSVILGIPPKVIWLQVGNCTTAQVEALLRGCRTAIEGLAADPALSVLQVRRP